MRRALKAVKPRDQHLQDMPISSPDPTMATLPKPRHTARLAWLCVPVLTLLSSGILAERSAERGAYMVELLGCARCHTEGLLTGDAAEGPHLAGSRIGIAYTAYNEQQDLPGVVFPSNLTSDPETGLGSWSRAEIIAALARGISKGGHERLTVMPWINYGAVKPRDLEAMADYLMTLPPVKRAVPESVPPGVPSREEYVRFGTYRFTPHWHLGTDPDGSEGADQSPGDLDP